MNCSLFSKDAVEYLKTLDSKSIDLVITDPPYESLEKWRAQGTTTRLKHSDASSNDWFEIFPNARFEELFAEFYRVLKDDTHCYAFCDFETLLVIREAAQKVGFKFWKGLIWEKQTIGMGFHYRAQHEFIAFLEKGKRKLNNLGIPDVLSFKKLKGNQFYPTEKPVELAEVLVSQSSDPGQSILDPFMGSGSVGEAALKLGRQFYGNDKSDKSLKWAENRLKDLIK